MRRLAALMLCACVPTEPRAPRLRGPVEVPITQRWGSTLFVPVELDGHQHAFVLDTGASITSITPRTAERADIVANGKTTVNGAIAAGLATVATLRVGTAQHDNVRVAIVDVPAAAALLQRYDGILGLDILAKYDTVIDLARGVLSLLPPGALARMPERAQFAKLTFQPGRNGLVRFDVTFDGKTMPAILDLGARITIVNRAAGGDVKLVTAMLSLGEVELGKRQVVVKDHPGFVQWGLSDRPAILLGADVLLDRTLVVAYGDRSIYVSR